MMTWWWLSYAESEPDKFLGVVILRASSDVDAHLRSSSRGLNPGGECRMIPIEQDPLHFDLSDYCDRLLTKEEATLLAGPKEI